MNRIGTDRIELRLAPQAESIGTVRTLAADLTGRADFDLDAISDVQMAVDEACNQVARHADPAHMMRVAFRVDGPDLRVTISARATAVDARIDTDGFGWTILGALTDELESEHGAGVFGDVIIVRLTKRDLGA